MSKKKTIAIILIVAFVLFAILTFMNSSTKNYSSYGTEGITRTTDYYAYGQKVGSQSQTTGWLDTIEKGINNFLGK